MKVAQMTGLLAAALISLAAAPAAPPYAVVQRIAGADGGWDLLSVDPAHKRLLVARTDGIMAIDLTTGAVTPKFVPGARFHAVFATPGTRLGIATSGQANA